MWTLEKPTIDGYYWLRKDSVDDRGPQIVHAYRSFDRVQYFTFCGNDTELEVTDYNWEWYGPIEPPK